MKKVEPPYPSTTWASDITIDFRSKEDLLIMGKLPITESDLEPSRDAFLRYLSSVKLDFAQKGTGRPSPHIIFANAVSDDELVSFVAEFGPVAAKEIHEIEPIAPEPMSPEARDKFDWRTSIFAVQDLATLRSERNIYASALELLAEARRGEAEANVDVIKKHISIIAEGASHWPQQWEAEQHWRASNSVFPMAWRFDSNHSDYLWQLEYDVYHRKPPGSDRGEQKLEDLDGTTDYTVSETDAPSIWSILLTTPYRASHFVLCHLLNAFDARIECFHGDRAVQELPYGAVRFGIRPVLYLILKHIYLGSTGVQICANDRCRHFFESKRGGQLYCSPDCSQQFRQREYWATSGSTRRKLRSAKKKSSRKRKRPGLR
jgi:hypothetical protein